MAQTITAVSIFLASPSDVTSERKLVASAISEWNDIYGRGRGVKFDLLRYETSVSAGFGEDGQQVINSQIGEDYDLLIALFWKRLGTKTTRARSGTVEEYERAFKRYKDDERIEIAFFFKDAPVDFRKEDVDQLKKVQDFEKEVQAAGALSKTFKDDDGLRFEINILLDRIAREHDPKSGSFGRSIKQHEGETATESDFNGVLSKVSGHEEDDVEELGILDFNERLIHHASAASDFLNQMGSRLESLTTVMEVATLQLKEIIRVRTIDPSEIKGLINPVASEMDRYSKFLEEEVSGYSEQTGLVFEDIRGIVDISHDFMEAENEEFVPNLEGFQVTVVEMRQGMIAAKASLTGYLNSVLGLQRMSSVFNKAKKRLVRNLESLNLSMERDLALIDQALGELAKLLDQARRLQGN